MVELVQYEDLNDLRATVLHREGGELRAVHGILCGVRHGQPGPRLPCHQRREQLGSGLRDEHEQETLQDVHPVWAA